MKKYLIFTLVFILAAFSFTGCKKKAPTPEPGKATADDMLALFPAEANAVFFVDFHRAMNFETVKNAIQKDKNYQKYQEFVEKTGLDPQKDIYYVCAAVSSFAGGPDMQQGAAVVNLKYNKENLLTLIEQKAQEEGVSIVTEEYSGKTIYTMEKEDEQGGFSFLDESNILLGNKEQIKAVIDVLEKKKENLFSNEELKSLLEKANKQAIMWGAALVPEQAADKMGEQNPMLESLKQIKSLTMYFDYLNNSFSGEIKAFSSDEAKNQEVADFLKGLKAMGSMASSEKPEIGELLNKITISSGPDFVSLTFVIPEELIKKLEEASKKAE